MKRGQGASGRTTLWEAKYGAAACSQAVRKHLDVSKKYDHSVSTLSAIEQFVRKGMPGFTQVRVDRQKQIVEACKNELLASWKTVGKQPGTLRHLAEIADLVKDRNGYSYPAEVAILESYQSGQRRLPELLAIAQSVNDNFSSSDLSEIIRRYNLSELKRGRPGRKPAVPELTEELDRLRIRWLQGTVSLGEFRRKQAELDLMREKQWEDAEAKTSIRKEKSFIERLRRKHIKKLTTPSASNPIVAKPEQLST